MKCNSLDLQTFQFDFDLTFCAFFLNPDKTVYARYGTRNGRDADNDVAIAGLAETMKAVLKIHSDYPSSKVLLSSKQSLPIEQAVPEDFPALDHFQSELDYSGQVAKSCIHCHQVRDAARLVYREQGQPLPMRLLFPFPSPETLGIEFDTRTASTVLRIQTESPASRAGLRSGDEIRLLDQQSIASEADFRWMLHCLDPESRQLNLAIDRDGERREVAMSLPEDWRQSADLSWRASSWELRRMATGGMTLKTANPEQRKRAGIADGKMGLRADHVGQYGHHARAKKAGLRKNDIVVSFDGRDDLLTENALIEYAVQKKSPGDEVEIRYVRNGKQQTARIRLQ